MGEQNTYPKLVRANYQKWSDRKVAMRQKEFGVWNEYTWKDVFAHIKYLSLAFIALGLQHNDRVCILGDNEPEWFWTHYAVQAAGGITVGIFPDATPPEVAYLFQHSDAKFVVCEDQEQVDKMLELKDELVNLKKVIYWDQKGMWSYDDPLLMELGEAEELGKRYDKEHPGLFDKSVDEGKGEDIAIFSYTSGTTGVQKGAILTFNNLFDIVERTLDFDPWYETDQWVSVASPAWIPEHVYGMGCCLKSGAVVNFPEEPETVMADLRQLGIQVAGFTPRHWEAFSKIVLARMLDADPIKEFFYNLFMPVGYRVARAPYIEGKVTPFWRVLWALGNLLVFRPLRDKLGLLHVRVALCGGSSMAPEIYHFYHAIGVNLKNFYGQTEALPLTCQVTGDPRFETAGIPMSSKTRPVEVRISDEGEILGRCGAVFQGYHKDPEATERTLTGNGWVRTGDVGYIDDQGSLIYIDRLKEMKELSTGFKFSPQFIEAKLRFSPYLQEAVVVGDKDKPYVSCLIAIASETVGRWAEKRGIPYTTFTDLSQKPEVRELIRREFLKVNRVLPPESRVRKFVTLHKELDADEAELTRTMKLRRSAIVEHFGEIANAMYGKDKTFQIATEVKYRDGRVGKITADVNINDVDTEITRIGK